MKRVYLSLCAFLVISVLLYAPVAQAGDMPEFTITDGWELDKVELYDLEYVIDGYPSPSLWPPTRVDMTGGQVGDSSDWNSGMFTYESSTFNVSGGTVDYLHTHDSSTVNISGGVVSHYDCSRTETITANESSIVNVYDGALLFGGSFCIFNLYDSSTLNVYGGDVTLFVLPRNSSIVNIYDGYFGIGIIPHDYSTANVYGGYIDSYTGATDPPDETATVNIYGYDFDYDPNARWRGDPCDGWWDSKLTGYGADGTGITYWALPDPSTHSNINLIPDFVMDRGVNLADFAAFASSWRTQKGDADWNHIYDISDPNDDVIGERDLAVFTKYWLAGVE
jgi:hypothetical protein